MHELSIAMNILDLAAAEAAHHEGRTIAVHLNLGALSGVVKDALLSAWELARRQTPLEDAALIVQELPVVGYCPDCEGEREVASVQQFSCAQCGAPIARVVRGRELEIVALEIDS